MVQAAQERRASPRKLVDGRMIRCPRCKRMHDVLQYTPMRLIEEFAAQTVPIYKCPKCLWLFAPLIDLDMLEEYMNATNGKHA